MSSSQFVVLLAVALVVTPLLVIAIPRARQSSAFDRILWLATLVTAFLGGWLGLAFGAGSGTPTGNDLAVLQVPVLPALLGAVVGALLLNLPLWLTDRLAASNVDDESDEPEILATDQDTNGNHQP